MAVRGAVEVSGGATNSIWRSADPQDGHLPAHTSAFFLQNPAIQVPFFLLQNPPIQVPFLLLQNLPIQVPFFSKPVQQVPFFIKTCPYKCLFSLQNPPIQVPFFSKPTHKNAFFQSPYKVHTSPFLAMLVALHFTPVRVGEKVSEWVSRVSNFQALRLASLF